MAPDVLADESQEIIGTSCEIISGKFMFFFHCRPITALGCMPSLVRC